MFKCNFNGLIFFYIYKYKNIEILFEWKKKILLIIDKFTIDDDDDNNKHLQTTKDNIYNTL